MCDGGHLSTRQLPSASRVRNTWCKEAARHSAWYTVIFDDRKTLLIILCMLGKSGVAVRVREDADEDDEDEERVEDGRLA